MAIEKVTAEQVIKISDQFPSSGLEIVGDEAIALADGDEFVQSVALRNSDLGNSGRAAVLTVQRQIPRGLEITQTVFIPGQETKSRQGRTQTILFNIGKLPG